jgi:hypothetical protein
MNDSSEKVGRTEVRPTSQRLTVPLEKLHGALMFLSLLARIECAQVAALAGLRVFLTRVEPILA